MTPEDLVRKIFADMNAANWLSMRISEYVGAGSPFSPYAGSEILYRESLADSVVPQRNRGSQPEMDMVDAFWVTSVVVAEPRVATFDGDFREWTAIQLILHIPPPFVQHGVGYKVLRDMDQEIMRRLRGRYTAEDAVEGYVNPNRLVNSTFVADFPGEGKSIERNRTVLVR